MDKNLFLTWNDITNDLKQLVSIIPKNKYQRMIIIGNGGLIPGYYIATALGIDIIHVISVDSYRKGKKMGVGLMKAYLPLDDFGQDLDDWLIVDDLIDSGDTIKLIKHFFPNADTAVLYKKPNSPEPTYFTAELDGWIQFPWEIPNFTNK